ncbi:MAG TPA: UDP-glucose 4-epimerase GalE [Nevskiaceae bacterium]|nr:UDP-glucose 4-epimerase GalE [Nevskiaceae bacterium]
MRVLVTGGVGFIGSHTVIELLKATHEVIIVDNFSNSDPEVLGRIATVAGQKPQLIEANIGNHAAMDKVLKDKHIEAVIHFAAYKAVGESVADPLKYYRNNVADFVSLLETMAANNINNFVFSSSAAVYGNPPTSPVTEDTPCAPTSPYGWSKYMDEIVLKDVCSATPALKGVALRYFNVVGAHDSGIIGELPKGTPQNLLPIIIQAVTGKLPPLTVFGTDYDTPDGTCLRDYIHVVDLARAHVAALDTIANQKTGNYSVYNIGTGKPTSVIELITTFEKINGIKVPYTLGNRRPGDPMACYASAQKARQELGWQATKTPEDAVRDAWRWQQHLQQK